MIAENRVFFHRMMYRLCYVHTNQYYRIIKEWIINIWDKVKESHRNGVN